jgi:hypothetical protein
VGARIRLDCAQRARTVSGSRLGHRGSTGVVLFYRRLLCILQRVGIVGVASISESSKCVGSGISILSCATFEVMESALVSDRSRFQERQRPFKDKILLEILISLVALLREDGYELTDAKHGMSCDAIARCILKDSSITLVLNVAGRDSGILKCDLLTWVRAPFRKRLRNFFRGASSQPETIEQWRRLCSAIDMKLRHQPGVRSVFWMTRDDAERNWSKAT